MKSRPARIALLLIVVTLITVVGVAHWMTSMPGESFAGAAEPDDATRMLATELRRDVTVLSSDIGERNSRRREALALAEQFLRERAQKMGYTVTDQVFEAGGKPFTNLVFDKKGSGPNANQILVVGAHYDSAPETPGANDNGSGVAALLALAREFQRQELPRTLRFALYANEEPPFFGTDNMGSRHHANKARDAGDNVIGMISLETIGSYSDEPDSQKYPAPFGFLYPNTGNFVAFVSRGHDRDFLFSFVSAFRKHARIASEGGALPEGLTGVYWSDHWSYWRAGFPALMVTDTAPFRYSDYHKPTDTPDKIDYHRLSLVVSGLSRAIEDALSAP
jgi:hypothetical protein